MSGFTAHLHYCRANATLNDADCELQPRQPSDTEMRDWLAARKKDGTIAALLVSFAESDRSLRQSIANAMQSEKESK